MPPALFVTASGFLAGTGGVQSATREYRQVIAAAGFDASVVPFEGDRRWSTRVGRRLVSSAYWRPAEPDLSGRIVTAAARTNAGAAFLNQCALAVLAPELRSRLPRDCRLVLLSHGLESTDLLHTISARRVLPLSAQVRPTAGTVLSHALQVEQATRPHLDAVCTLSAEDAVLETWMGTAHVDWLPRLIEPRPLPWAPVENRVGFVGTLDHAPNLEGLVAVLRQLPAESPIRVRVAGGPSSTGAWLAASYPAVEYLGALSDDALVREAASWCAFLHPLFYLSRGCSTKLATGLGWQLPIVTTAVGRRGYTWREGGVVEAGTPEAFVEAVDRLRDRDEADRARERVMAAAASAPSLAENAARFLALVNAR